MTAISRRVIAQVAREHGVDSAGILGSRRFQNLTRARIEIAKRLHAHGYCPNRIAGFLNKHHTSIWFYLGALADKQPSLPLRWHRPRVKRLYKYLTPKRQRKPLAKTKRSSRPIPYAGFDPSETQLRERHGN